MSQRTDDPFDKLRVTPSLSTGEFVAACRAAIREIDDPAELQARLREMVEQEFPVAKPVFEAGETLPMHEFLSRYQQQICGGVVPQFYSAPVVVMGCTEFGVLIRIEAAG